MITDPSSRWPPPWRTRFSHDLPPSSTPIRPQGLSPKSVLPSYDDIDVSMCEKQTERVIEQIVEGRRSDVRDLTLCLLHCFVKYSRVPLPATGLVGFFNMSSWDVGTISVAKWQQVVWTRYLYLVLERFGSDRRSSSLYHQWVRWTYFGWHRCSRRWDIHGRRHCFGRICLLI